VRIVTLTAYLIVEDETPPVPMTCGRCRLQQDVEVRCRESTAMMMRQRYGLMPVSQARANWP
jgi:hypothetical protein